MNVIIKNSGVYLYNTVAELNRRFTWIYASVHLVIIGSDDVFSSISHLNQYRQMVIWMLWKKTQIYKQNEFANIAGDFASASTCLKYIYEICHYADISSSRAGPW